VCITGEPKKVHQRVDTADHSHAERATEHRGQTGPLLRGGPHGTDVPSKSLLQHAGSAETPPPKGLHTHQLGRPTLLSVTLRPLERHIHAAPHPPTHAHHDRRGRKRRRGRILASHRRVALPPV
jgi:hypothetical protein